MKTLKFTVMMLLLAGMAHSMMAQQRGDRNQQKQRIEKMHENHKKMRQHMRLPDLSDQQKEQIKQITLDTRQEILPLQNELREHMARLKTLETADKADMDAVNGVIEEIGAIRTRIMSRRAASKQEVRALLTKEQRIVFDSRMARKKGRALKQRLSR